MTGAILKDTGNLAEAEQLFLRLPWRKASRRRARDGRGDAEPARGRTTTTRPRRGRGAIVAQRRSLRFVAIFGDKHPVVATTTNDLGAILYMDNRPAEAEPFFRELPSCRIEIYGEEHPDVAESRTGLAVMLREQKKFPEAEVMLRQSLAIQRSSETTTMTSPIPWAILARSCATRTSSTKPSRSIASRSRSTAKCLAIRTRPSV